MTENGWDPESHLYACVRCGGRLRDLSSRECPGCAGLVVYDPQEAREAARLLHAQTARDLRALAERTTDRRRRELFLERAAVHESYAYADQSEGGRQ